MLKNNTKKTSKCKNNKNPAIHSALDYQKENTSYLETEIGLFFLKQFFYIKNKTFLKISFNLKLEKTLRKYGAQFGPVDEDVKFSFTSIAQSKFQGLHYVEYN